MKIILIIPSLNLTGPAKGIFALSKLLNKHFKVTLVSLKKNTLTKFELPKNVNLISLEKQNFLNKFLFLRSYCKKNNIGLILSACFSADIINLLLRKKAKHISSIRANLIKNYFSTYSFFGLFLAYFHFFIQNFFSDTIVMNRSMYSQVRRYSGKKSTIINNFIDENELKEFFKKDIDKSKKISYTFIGKLIGRKGIFNLIKSFKELLNYQEAELHIIGDGPLRGRIKNVIKKSGICDKVIMHGFIKSPYSLLKDSDVFVLPSYSEGTSRASLEALFLGIPVVLRDVDGNRELVHNNDVLLFENDKDLTQAMINQSNYSRKRLYRKNLLPEPYMQKNVLESYLKLLKN